MKASKDFFIVNKGLNIENFDKKVPIINFKN